MVAAYIKRMNKARNFPDGTCPASRHVAIMAETLAKRRPYSMLSDEPESCAESMAATVESLWKARALLDKAGIKWWGPDE